MKNRIRKAQLADVPQLVELSENRRSAYEKYQPIFWRKAEDSHKIQSPYFEQLIAKQGVIALVHENNREIDGFVIAAVVSAPPVYDPGGLACVIDGFCVAEEDQWQTLGTVLMREAAQRAKEQGAVQVVVVCGHLDQHKRSMLVAGGFTIASEWYVRNT